MRELLMRFQKAPWTCGFIALLRRFGAAQPDAPRIGLARRPRQEAFRLGQVASLAFAPREVAELVLPDGEVTAAGRGNQPSVPMVRLFGLGLLGPNGPLPLHYTELVRERTEHHGDTTLADFIDLFHHRYLTHVYRAWAQAQAAAGLDRVDDETFSRYVAWLTGHDPLEIRDSVLPAHARLSASAHLVHGSRHVDGLAGTLAHYFGVQVVLETFVLHWIGIDPQDRTRLGQASVSCILGEGAVLGEVVADRQSKFRLVVGPLRLADYLRFTPGGRDLPVLVEWVRAFVGYEFVWDVELRVRRDDVPPARLDESQRLGWSTWLGDDAGEPRGHAVGMVFEPESAMSSAETACA
ncbi:type VI secretion system baseplate subunit TssG [Variovorax sp. RHLX14]|uniref:type VI secretion system baseplate subunit TssG n=1 Tax=Variovorax sp. RHLX14 TaxID=1259731 RepID=UPI003F46E6D4